MTITGTIATTSPDCQGDRFTEECLQDMATHDLRVVAIEQDPLPSAHESRRWFEAASEGRPARVVGTATLYDTVDGDYIRRLVEQRCLFFALCGHVAAVDGRQENGVREIRRVSNTSVMLTRFPIGDQEPVVEVQA